VAKRAIKPEQTRTKTRPWLVYFFQRAEAAHPHESVPAREFLDRCPTSVAAKFIAVIKAVADAPPPAFSGGGKWEAMHGDMAGFYEVRVDGPSRRHYRLFCLLERAGEEVGLMGSGIVLLTGMDKPFRTTFTRADYEKVRALGDEYLARNPRSVAR
jgi:Txe/YoeB family toxin of Txe-Axe toxin-antitoxin module